MDSRVQVSWPRWKLLIDLLNANSMTHDIIYSITQSPLGRLLVAATSKGICMISAGDSDKALLQRMHKQFPRETITRDEAAIKKSVAQVLRVIKGETLADTLQLDLRGTEFQKKVWSELLRIPPGVTRSYSEIAGRINHPTAYRAVANACGANPIPIVVPCHRVVASDGSIGGYGLGLDRKRALLLNEGVDGPTFKTR